MTQVQCNVSSCSYNKGNGCYMNPINVGGKGAAYDNSTCCGSYLNQQHYSNLAEYTSNRGETDCVECNVNSCKFNSDCYCSKDTIEVGGGNSASIYTETKCASFERE